MGANYFLVYNASYSYSTVTVLQSVAGPWWLSQTEAQPTVTEIAPTTVMYLHRHLLHARGFVVAMAPLLRPCCNSFLSRLALERHAHIVLPSGHRATVPTYFGSILLPPPPPP